MKCGRQFGWIKAVMADAPNHEGGKRLSRACRLLAHRVISIPRGICVTFGPKPTFTFVRTPLTEAATT